MREKLFAAIAEEVLLISILIIEKYWHPWRITSWKMFFVMCLFFGVSVIIAKEVELFVLRTMFKGGVVVPEKVTWVLYRALCILIFFLIFCGFAGYVITLILGDNSDVIKYGGLSAILHFLIGYLFDSLLGISPKSPFDIELERELEENDKEIRELCKELEMNDSENEW